MNAAAGHINPDQLAELAAAGAPPLNADQVLNIRQALPAPSATITPLTAASPARTILQAAESKAAA